MEEQKICYGERWTAPTWPLGANEGMNSCFPDFLESGRLGRRRASHRRAFELPEGCSWIVCTRHAAATVDGNRIEEGEARFTINDRESIIAAGV